MNTGHLLLILFVLVSGSTSSSFGAEDYHKYIRQFASNTPPDKVLAALQAIRRAGTNAFPALLAHVNDKTLAERNTFQRAQVAPPTIGDACFDQLQGQIEGTWPKGYRDYHILTRENVHSWLARHTGLSLQQLRVEAAQQSLKRAEADIPKKADSDWHRKTLEFLRKNLEEAKQNAA